MVKFSISVLYLCLFLFFLFLWLPWWLPEEEEEAAFWGFRSCSVESTSSVSSWLGSFSWFWRSGEVSLSVPLPASPEGTKKDNTNTVRNDQRLSQKKFSKAACQLTFFIHVIWYPTKRTYRLQIKIEYTQNISYFLMQEKSLVREGLTATDVTDDLLNKRSASLNFLFLLSVLLLEFLLELQNKVNFFSQEMVQNSHTVPD